MPALRWSLPKLSPPRWSLGELAASSSVAIAVAGGGLRITATRGHELSFWQHVPLPRGLLRNGWIADAVEFGEALRNILDNYELGGARVLFTLPGNAAIARLLSIKLAGAREPDALVAHEAAWAMPVSPEQYYLHWQPVADGFPDHVFVLAVQRDALDNLLRACATAKVRPHVVDLKPLALVLAIGRPDAIVADVERTSIDILIVAHGVPVAMRSLHLGDEPLEPAFVRAKLVDELTIAMQLYDQTNPELPLEPALPVCLTGDLGDAGLASQVAFATKHPVVEPQTPFPCPVGFPAGRFMANLGLLQRRA